MSAVIWIRFHEGGKTVRQVYGSYTRNDIATGKACRLLGTQFQGAIIEEVEVLDDDDDGRVLYRRRMKPGRRPRRTIPKGGLW